MLPTQLLLLLAAGFTVLTASPMGSCKNPASDWQRAWCSDVPYAYLMQLGLESCPLIDEAIIIVPDLTMEEESFLLDHPEELESVVRGHIIPRVTLGELCDLAFSELPTMLPGVSVHTLFQGDDNVHLWANVGQVPRLNARVLSTDHSVIRTSRPILECFMEDHCGDRMTCIDHKCHKIDTLFEELTASSQYLCPLNHRKATIVNDCDQCHGHTLVGPGSSRVCGAVETRNCNTDGCDTYSIAGNVNINVGACEPLPHLNTPNEECQQPRCPMFGHCSIDHSDVRDSPAMYSCPLVGDCSVECQAECKNAYIRCPRNGKCDIMTTGEDALRYGSMVEGGIYSGPDNTLDCSDACTRATIVVGSKEAKLSVGCSDGGCQKAFGVFGRGTGELDITCTDTCNGALAFVASMESPLTVTCEDRACNDGLLVESPQQGVAFDHACNGADSDGEEKKCDDGVTTICNSGSCTTTCGPTSKASCGDRYALLCNTEAPGASGCDIVCPDNGNNDCNKEAFGICTDATAANPDCQTPIRATLDYCNTVGTNCKCSQSGDCSRMARCVPTGACTIDASSPVTVQGAAVALCPIIGDCTMKCGPESCSNEIVITGPYKQGDLHMICAPTRYGCETHTVEGDCKGAACDWDNNQCFYNEDFGACKRKMTTRCPSNGKCHVECSNFKSADVLPSCINEVQIVGSAAGKDLLIECGVASCRDDFAVQCPRDGGACDLKCMGANSCSQDVIVNGLESEHLEVVCDGEGSCADKAMFVCPAMGSCTIHCKNGACKHNVAVKCPEYGDCQVLCDDDSCTHGPTILCPTEATYGNCSANTVVHWV